jgi:translation initiation factor IF-2
MDVKIGKVTHYYSRLSVAVLELEGDLAVGEQIMILGKTTELTQMVTSMQIEHHNVQAVKAGMQVALKVIDQVRQGDLVYKVTD